MTALNLEELSLMRESCRLAAQTLSYLGMRLKEGMTTAELDLIAYEYIMDHQATPAPLNYHGFPKSICTSVNDCVCHGVPNEKTFLKAGDIINVDVTCLKDGFFGDTSKTFFIGEVSKEAKEITQKAHRCMMKGIEAISAHGHVGDIGFAISKEATKLGVYPVRNIGGHGIGKVFHEDPFVASYGKKNRGEVLQPWACITVEPMVNEVSEDVLEYDIPGSSIKYYKTSDGSLSAQFEHTILISPEHGYEILTQPSQ